VREVEMRQVVSIGPLHLFMVMVGCWGISGTMVHMSFLCDIFMTSTGWGRDLVGVSFIISAFVRLSLLRVENGSGSQAAHRYPAQGTRR